MHRRSRLPFPRLATLVAIALLAILAVASTASAALRVTVRPGDTLTGIATRYGVSPERIAAQNRLRNGNLIIAGHVLRIPGRLGPGGLAAPAGTYTVRAGDTLSAIAARAGTSVGQLARRNGLRNPHVIAVGMRLRVDGLRGLKGGPRVGTNRSVSGGYTVRRGDTLGAIAARYGTSAGALARANRLSNPSVLRIGQRLRLSAPVQATAAAWTGGRVHTVRAGETVSAIAARYGVSIRRIAATNGLDDPGRIRVGARLRIPGAATVTMSSGPLTPITAATSGWGRHPSKAAIRALMSSHAARYGVDPALVRAVGWQESGWWQGARSSTGAIGVMQLMPGTAAWIGPALMGRMIDPYNASDNIAGGVAYLAYLERTSGSRRLAIASYYQGLGSVTTRGLLGETEVYVSSVTSFIGRV